MDIIEELKGLKGLLDQGAISEAEFNLLKQKAMSHSRVNENIKEMATLPQSSHKRSKQEPEESTDASLNVKEHESENMTINKALGTEKNQLDNSPRELDLTKDEALSELNKRDVGVLQQNLVYYSQVGDYKRTELLLIAGLNPNELWFSPQLKRNINPLHISAGWGTPKMVKLLLSYGADIDREDDHGNTPLFYAIKQSTKQKVKLLLERGADMNHKNKEKITPLFYARKLKKSDIAELLLKAGAEGMNPKEINEYRKRKNQRGMIIGVASIFVFVFFWWVFAGSSDTIDNSSSNSNSSSQQDDNSDDKYVRDYIIGRAFEYNGSSLHAYIKFSDSDAGWFGIMTLGMDDCQELYRYETKGRTISLTYTSSNCASQGRSAHARFNSDNTVSIFFDGQELIFKPMF